jgi:hypothetical protein
MKKKGLISAWLPGRNMFGIYLSNHPLPTYSLRAYLTLAGLTRG